MHLMLKILHTFKFKIFIVLLCISLLTLACDNKQAPVEQNADLIYDTVPKHIDSNASAPYSSEKFHNILDQSNYQYPYAQTIAYRAEYGTFQSDAFYLDKNGDLYFSLYKDLNTIKKRSEIRQVCKNPQTGAYDTNSGWKTSDENGNFWIGEVRCFKPAITQSYTWMQVHGIDGANIVLNDGTVVKSFNYPLIRLTWERYRDGVYDHIWAIVITSYPRTPKVYEWTDLGPRPNSFFKAEVHFQNNIMKIVINDIVMNSYDVTYWEEEINYFKAGIYINRFSDGGEASIAYRKLRFDTNISI